MTETVFITGFPGFLGSALLPRILSRLPGAEAACLVQPRYVELARARATALAAADPALRGRIRIVAGDITAEGLGMRDAALASRVTEIFHLAAIYDLSVAHDVGMRVNVDGTRRVLAFARGCPSLRRLHYVSTCYVSGRYPGTFTEDMLEEGQPFNNFYEQTKQLAEVEVRAAMREGLPATIYRPSIVVGDSRTGATQKFDGPYFALQWLMRQPRVAVMPVIRDGRAHEFNVVPRDFVVDAMAYLSGLSGSLARTYALADPHPPTVDAMLQVLARAAGRRMLTLPLPPGVAKALIRRVPGLHAVMRIPPGAVDYFVHPTHYDTSHASADLASAGIACPPVATYADRLADFMRTHPDVGPGAMT